MNDKNQIHYNNVESVSNISLRSKARAYQAIVSLGREDGNFTSFQEAINYVWNTPQKTGVVLVMPGTYVQTADIAIYSGIKLMGFDPALTIIDFDGDRNIICYGDDTADNSGNDIIFQGLQFKDSTDTAGAVNCNSCTRVDFTHCIFTNNTLDIGSTSATGIQLTQTNIGGSQISSKVKDEGWIPVLDGWLYASASTITVPSGAASIYQKGDKIKWTQTTVKYGVIVEVADTVLTIAVNTDYTVANEAISDIYVSKAENPQGFPDWFNYTPTYSASGSMTYTSVSTDYSKFKITGKFVHFWIKAIGTTGGTASISLYVSYPVTPASAVTSVSTPAACYIADGATATAGFSFNSSAGITFRKTDSSNWGLGTSRAISGYTTYEI